MFVSFFVCVSVTEIMNLLIEDASGNDSFIFVFVCITQKFALSTFTFHKVAGSI